MKLKVIGAPDSHEALIKKMSALSPQRVLDAPAGTGALASKLIEMGHDVHCADIDRQHFQLSGVEHTTADLNHGLPQLDNASFDSVVCCNGAHRLYSLPNAFQEFARILKPGGNLLINVNNYASIDRRLRFLVYGSLDNAVNAQHCNQNITDPAAHVRVALLVPQLINHLTRAGFEIKAINAASKRPIQRVLAPAAMICQLAGNLVPKSSRMRNHLEWTNCGGILMGGRYMLIEATRREETHWYCEAA